MTNKTITLSRELVEELLDGFLDPRCTIAKAIQSALADPVPPAGGAPAPEYFVAACDKFDWTPEEALRFYAEGKHFDVVDGRTRILCTGAIASHALKGIGGEYADMKGMAPAGGDVEVLGYSVKGNRYAIRLTKAELLELYEGYAGDALIELVDRAHVTQLKAEVERQRNHFREQLRDAKNADALQFELTKARELLREWLTSNFTGSCPERNDLRCRTDYALSNQSAPADKGGDDWHMNPCKQGHRDVGAAGGVAHCYTCDEKIEAATTQEAFERWNATHPVEQPAHAEKGQGEPVARITLQQVLKAYDYAESHPHKYLRGTTNWCAAVAHSLNAEQSAPVAVVMPERLAIQSHWPEWKINGAEGWNACLDEFARLNSVPKP